MLSVWKNKQTNRKQQTNKNISRVIKRKTIQKNLPLMSHTQPFFDSSPTVTHWSSAPFPQPSQSYLTDFTIADISCPSSDKRHVDSGLCPEIKQYAVTGKKTNQNYTHNSMRIVHTHTFTHGRPVVTPTSKKTNNGNRKSAFPCGEPVYGTIWALCCWQQSLEEINNLDLLMWKRILQLLSHLCPPPLSFAVSDVPSSICVRGLAACGGEFVKSSISCQLRITHILPQTAPAGNPMMLLPSCSSMLLILFSEGNKIFGGFSVKGAEKEKRHN